MLLNKNIQATLSNLTYSNSVEKKLENKVKSFHKKLNNHLQMVWLTDKNGNLTAHWTTQD
ncbi:MAG: hypothetical protein AB4080_16570 [Trichodesmium sp.]